MKKYRDIAFYGILGWLLFMSGVGMGEKHPGAGVAIVVVWAFLLFLFSIFWAGYEKRTKEEKDA